MQSIDAETLKQKLDKGEQPLLLDVREMWEYELCRIGNSINVPMSSIAGKCNELDRKRETVVICHHGDRSRQVAAFLESKGFEKVRNLEGGVHDWAQTIDPDMPMY